MMFFSKLDHNFVVNSFVFLSVAEPKNEQTKINFIFPIMIKVIKLNHLSDFYFFLSSLVVDREFANSKILFFILPFLV